MKTHPAAGIGVSPSRETGAASNRSILPDMRTNCRRRWLIQTHAALAAGLCVFFSPGEVQADTVKAYRSRIELPTYSWEPAVPHPYFRGTDKVNIYPYPMMDNLSRAKTNRPWRTVVLENDYLRVTFLPDLGGKIFEVIDKTTAQPVFYVNHVVKPGLIGQCGAWSSGGIEWNTGPQGHTVSAMQPVEVQILPTAPDGSRSVAVGELERIYHTRWTVVVRLRPGRSFLEEDIRIYNLTETVRPYYFWNCTAVPNTPGFRFIYPMTLGTDHAETKFFQWPMDQGKDLSRGTNYQDASSIFAWFCDQDFFGSYDDTAERGVVSVANHHQVPGKKAWTWGQGSFGRMHQMDLTDKDGPYNEVQTGPLLTQGEVGRLDPHEGVSWQEWWYPIHGLGGFTFANRDLAANAGMEGGKLRVRVLATGVWRKAEVSVRKSSSLIAAATCGLSPRIPADLRLSLDGAGEPLQIEIRTERQVLASFRLPLALPARTPPAKREVPGTATELAQAGWQDYLFARFPEAASQFTKALELDARCANARAGLAYVKRDSDPAAAAAEARKALAADPDNGLARIAVAGAEYRLGNESTAIDDAWAAALDPATAVAGRALAAKLLLRRGDWGGVGRAISEVGPWQADPVCRNRLALALFENGEPRKATELARVNLAVEPLDPFAQSILWLAGSEVPSQKLADLVSGKPAAALDLAIDYAELGQERIALRVLDTFCPDRGPVADPLVLYWRAYLAERIEPSASGKQNIRTLLQRAQTLPTTGVFPDRHETVPVLRRALELNPDDGSATLYLGHLLFALGRHTEGRDLWAKAAQLGAAPAVAWRALGMAALNLDGDAESAAKLLARGHDADPSDAIIARDLARVWLGLADKSEAAERKRSLLVEARKTLNEASAAGRSRSDFVTLLARTQNRLGEFAETARLLDSVRITVWEGVHEAHDLFEEAHLALGKGHLEAGQANEALREFDRALEYPDNLATGKLEETRDAHIHFLRGNALSALGQKQAAVEAWKRAAEEPGSKDEKKEAARAKAREALDATFHSP